MKQEKNTNMTLGEYEYAQKRVFTEYFLKSVFTVRYPVLSKSCNSQEVEK